MAKVTMPLKSSLIFLIITVLCYWISYDYFDQSIAYFMHQHISTDQPLYWFSYRFDYLFDPDHWVIVMGLAFFYTLWLYFRKKPKERVLSWLIVTFSLFVALAIGAIIKFGLARYRPELLFSDQLYGFHFLSMNKLFNSTPSGHALASFAGLLSLFLIPRCKFALTFAMTLATVICITRVLVSDHYLSDIILGAYIGIFSVLWVRWFILSVLAPKLIK